VLAVRWYLRYGLSYRDVEELLAEGTVNLVADKGVRGRLGQDGLAVVPWSGGCWGQSGDLVPSGESGGHFLSVLGCGESVASRSEVW
jgi:hypothetical protein